MYFPVHFVALLSVSPLLQALAKPGSTADIDVASFSPDDILDKDVAIIGGGSAGCYSAISLKDKGKSVVVIEKKDRVGGNTETYIDPATGTPIDIGVLVFHNISVVTDYFNRFDVPLTPYGEDDNSGQSAYYDFSTGAELNLSFPSANKTAAAFTRYAEFLEEYPRLNDGLFLPNPVPEDLIMPFGEFADRYDIGASLNTMYELDPAVGNFTTVPTVERMRTMSLSLVQQTETGFLTTAHHNNSEIYSKIQTELLSASSLLLDSEVISTLRKDGREGISLVVRTLNGYKLIFAKRLLITIPPKLDILAPLDLSAQEESVFSRFIDVGYYTSIVNDTGLPDDLSIFNYNPNTPYNFPILPGVYNIQATPVPGLHLAIYGTPRGNKSFSMPTDQVKADIIKGIKTLQQANPVKFKQTEPEFVVFSSHTPFYLQVSADDIKDGFYDKLYALQGLRNTYWTGAAFRGQDSSDLWRYSKEEFYSQLCMCICVSTLLKTARLSPAGGLP
ncbi:amine oxidase, flavin-containing superfamily [Talaromyces stipitatus ATCC 10500]|uniref:Amine oxidase, flavin-containing superfamily n=1 Tax=Talaromyces stipitatus (strain ATCC 10500 / CBS 375.48 / QM 6759 / NRRL 1006) TaxID=441959 RepID=B8M2U7_TALSN|nr:amine oxidase, flavin-containing superfamily [Talaromyces stipitatus ATCC 10500]EED22202.1 amine oxidase, flavin-containing superfamily [Talaromyces stipitatus ATCC 10500]